MRKLLFVFICLVVSVVSTIDWHDMSECIGVNMVIGKECQEQKKTCHQDQACIDSMEGGNDCGEKCVKDLKDGAEFPFSCMDACVENANVNFRNLYNCSKNYCVSLIPPQLLFLQ